MRAGSTSRQRRDVSKSRAIYPSGRFFRLIQGCYGGEVVAYFSVLINLFEVTVSFVLKFNSFNASNLTF